MIPFRLVFALLVVVLLGAGVFVWQILGANPGEAWQSFLVNLLFFSAVAQSGSVLAAIYHLTEARWGSRVMPLAIGLGSFLPISFILFLVLFAAFPYFPAYSTEFPARRFWFNYPFLIGRDVVGIALLYAVSLAFSYRFLISSLDLSSGRLTFAALAEKARPSREQRTDANGRTGSVTALAIFVLAVYAVVFSILAFDLVMGLDRQWYSTLFGGYFFISSFYVGLASIAVTVFLVSRHGDPTERVSSDAFGDLGKLVFAFCLLTAYFFWAQYLVIWYGNLPEEVGFLMRRFHDPTWRSLTWVTITLTFAIPFLGLLSQRTKQSAALFFIAIIVLIGMWLERYLLIVPSLSLPSAIGLGWPAVVITLSFFATTVFSYTLYLRFYDALKSKSALESLRAKRPL